MPPILAVLLEREAKQKHSLLDQSTVFMRYLIHMHLTMQESACLQLRWLSNDLLNIESTLEDIGHGSVQ
jgi:hypothetical protein